MTGRSAEADGKQPERKEQTDMSTGLNCAFIEVEPGRW
jgi:hypothetical protein